MKLLSRRKIRIRNRVVICYPGIGIDFIKDRLDVVHKVRYIIIHVGRHSIRNVDGMFERSKILLKKYKEL